MSRESEKEEDEKVRNQSDRERIEFPGKQDREPQWSLPMCLLVI